MERMSPATNIMTSPAAIKIRKGVAEVTHTSLLVSYSAVSAGINPKSNVRLPLTIFSMGNAYFGFDDL
jgi:hypothetical protein